MTTTYQVMDEFTMYTGDDWNASDCTLPSTGKWVKYEDHKAITDKLYIELEQVRNERNAAHVSAANAFARDYGRSKY